MRTVVCLLAVLLALTPVTQALAQAEQQEQEPDATEMSNSGTAIQTIPALDRDTVPLVRLEAASIFPITDSPAAYDSAAATPAPAAISTVGWVAIAVVVVVVGLFLAIVIGCSGGACS